MEETGGQKVKIAFYTFSPFSPLPLTFGTENFKRKEIGVNLSNLHSMRQSYLWPGCGQKSILA